MDLYQEQPHLIDPKLQNFIDILLEEMRNWNSHGKKLLREQIFMFLCQIIKVRGYKVSLKVFDCLTHQSFHVCLSSAVQIVVRYLPHEVGQLELVLGLLETENKEKRPHWETRYVLLIWLAIICKNPFDMYRFDVGTAVIPIRERIME